MAEIRRRIMRKLLGRIEMKGLFVLRFGEKTSRCPESARAMKSNVLDQFGDTHFEGAGNPAQRGK